MSNFTATIKGKTLHIEIPLCSPRASASGKSFTVATTGGIQGTTLQLEGKPVKIGVNAFVSAK